MSRKFELYKIVKTGLKALNRTNISLYWNKYSRHDYTTHQHIMLIVLACHISQFVITKKRIMKEIAGKSKSLGG